MDKINSIGTFFIKELGIRQKQITKERVFDIISIQDHISPYSVVGTREIRWKIQ